MVEKAEGSGRTRDRYVRSIKSDVDRGVVEEEEAAR
jgi:hypothetical protein